MIRKIEILMAIFLLVSSGAAVTGDEERLVKEFGFKAGKTAEVILEVDAGEVRIEKGEGPDVLSLRMEYEKDEFEYDIDYDESGNRISISLDKKGWFSSGDTHALIELSLPSGIELILNTRVKAGEIDMELGDLSIREFILNNLAGEVEVSFDRPNRSRMDYLKVHSKVGETELLKLGNSRFMEAEINSEIGELHVDFRGEPLRGARAEVDLEIGEIAVEMPDDVGIKIDLKGGGNFLRENNIDSAFYRKGGYYFNDKFESEDEGFVIRLSLGMGELNLNQRRGANI